MKKIFCILIVFCCALLINAADIQKDGVYYNISSTKEMTLKVVGYDDSFGQDIVIPDVVVYRNREYIPTEIEHAAFQNRKLRSIKIGGNITHIGFWAFKGCKRLIELEIPDNVKELMTTNIGYSDLCDGCEKLEKVTIGNGIELLPAGLFNNCINLREIVIGENVKCVKSGSSLSTMTFPQNSEKLTKITLLPIEPPLCYGLFLYNIDYTCIELCVPEESVEYYLNDCEWGKFSFVYSSSGEKVGIQNITKGKTASSIIYDLSGKPVTNPKNGIYIQNGKKFYIRKH